MNDVISRQAAIDELDKGAWGVEWDKTLAKAMIESLPSAQPERKKGEWIITKTERGWNCAEYPTEVTCSNCNYIEDYQKALDFCPNCGADMRGEENEGLDL